MILIDLHQHHCGHQRDLIRISGGSSIVAFSLDLGLSIAGERDTDNNPNFAVVHCAQSYCVSLGIVCCDICFIICNAESTARISVLSFSDGEHQHTYYSAAISTSRSGFVQQRHASCFQSWYPSRIGTM